VRVVYARTATLADFDGMVALWKAAGLRFRVEPVAEELATVLEHDPDLVLVVEDGGSIVASVLGTWDGRRGWVNRLATHPGHRGRGLARLLITELETRLRAKGCRKVTCSSSRTTRPLSPGTSASATAAKTSSSWTNSCSPSGQELEPFHVASHQQGRPRTCAGAPVGPVGYAQVTCGTGWLRPGDLWDRLATPR